MKAEILKKVIFNTAVDYSAGVTSEEFDLNHLADDILGQVILYLEAESNIGKLALVGDVWYQIMDMRIEDEEEEYQLFSREGWIPHSHIKEIKERQEKVRMPKISSFISQDNLEHMSHEELMSLWAFLISPHEQAYTLDRVKAIIDKRTGGK